MQPVTQMPMPELDIVTREFGQDALSHLAAARKQSWLAKSVAGYVILDYQGMRDLLSMDDKLRTPNEDVTRIMNAENTRWGQWNNTFLLSKRGDVHKRIRDLIAPTFTPRNADNNRQLMRDAISTLLDEWAPRGRFDFTEFASYFPITVMCKLIGAPTDAVPKIKDALEVLGSGFDLNPALLPKLDAAFILLWDFVADLIAERRRTGHQGAPDLLDALLAANAENDRLTDEELHSLVLLLFGGGYDTSKNLMGVIMYLMLERPQVWARMAAEPPFARKIIEEALRHTSVVTTYRVALEDIEYRDVVFPKNTMLVFPLPFAGRDESVFSDAGAFDPDRSAEKRHFAFGRGAHNCVGQFIARAQIEEALPLVAARLVNPRLDGEPIWRTFPGIWGLQKLPIAFDAPATN